jgi:two-component system, NarL family, response regulator DegU
MTNKIKVAITDDHEVVRTGLIGILKQYEDIEIVLEANNGQELIEKLKSKPVDVIILDIKMPILDGLQTLKIIRESDPSVRIIMLTVHETKSFILESVEGKANGYLNKKAKAEEIYIAIKKSLSEGFYYSEFACDILFKNIIIKNNIIPFKTEPSDEFDEKQWKVLKLLYDGKTSKEISKELFLSKSLVDKVRSSLLKVTNTNSTSDLIKWSYENKIFE